jgi:hypothetical protein
MALHVVKVYVMCVWRRHVGSKGIEEGRGQEEEGGRNGFDEHQEIKQNKVTESPNSQQSGNINTKLT